MPEKLRAKGDKTKETRGEVKPSIRKPPEGDAQADFCIPLLYDVATKDSCGLGHLGHGLQGAQDGRGDFKREAALLELLLAGALAGLARLDDVHLLGGDADIARRGHHV